MGVQVKCLVWDLDETLWNGTLVEGDAVALKPGIVNVLAELANRGILNSVASRNDCEPAMAELKRLGVEEFFVAPHIDHSPKPDSLQEISQTLNISLDSLAFIDNDPFERAAVEYSFPEIMVIEAEKYAEIPGMEAFNVVSGTAEADERVKSYRVEAKRREAESVYAGTRLDFLKTCKMELATHNARRADIARVVELAERTNQFNSSGVRYREDEVAAIMDDPDARIAIGHLTDRFGDSGIIAAMVLRRLESVVLVESLMVSCRVDGRSIPSAMLVLAMRSMKQMRALQARLHATQKNRRLLFLYQMMGFTPLVGDRNLWSFHVNTEPIPEIPEWLRLTGTFPQFDT